MYSTVLTTKVVHHIHGYSCKRGRTDERRGVHMTRDHTAQDLQSCMYEVTFERLVPCRLPALINLIQVCCTAACSDTCSHVVLELAAEPPNLRCMRIALRLRVRSGLASHLARVLSLRWTHSGPM